MIIAGFLLLLAGWGLVLAAVALLKSIGLVAAFVLAGIAVEGLGLGIVVRSHISRREER